MAAEQLNIGFISPGPATWPHYDSFRALIPEFVKFDFQGLDLYGKSLYETPARRRKLFLALANWHLPNHGTQSSSSARRLR